ncbi:Coiled-coil domain-containing protein 87, variant 2 [Schistosoma haematobium]|uniref:Coiled-coil domain-containing protein 87, variant 2 n=1 Tax=Schistosoma haematobium TaxID=6185 RepID=A0A922LKC8_SCHHA|nr:Coiled-coil domain-containing protein 87, variant 2 [Schistosoma haematobium]KAH9587862.1 Coiled-coil domain-containing protein 87, variant 2 [Schistosoma haematobium]
MSITLLGFKTMLTEELGNSLEEDLRQMVISITTQELEKIKQELICSFKDSKSFSLDGTQWSKIIKTFAKIVKELSLGPGAETNTSAFSSQQESIPKAFREIVYMYNKTVCSDNQGYSDINNGLSLEESQRSPSQFETNYPTDLSTNVCTDSECEYFKVGVLRNLSDEILLNQLQAKPILSISQQPSFLMKSFENTVILTPDVRPTDRRCVSENLLQTMGPLWNEYAKEVDEETDIQLDRNLPILDENDEIFTNLINTIAKDFNEMKFTSDNENFKFFEIPVPDEIDMKPTYETACQLFNNNSKSVLTNLSQSFLTDKSKWILPILKLHTDEDETMFRRTKTLPSSKLDELFIHEVNKYKKRSEKVENISVDNFNEKYEKTLVELKNEEQKFNKLKQKLIICQYKSNEVPSWNTGNDMIVNNDSSDYELLNNCEEKINLLKLNLMNLINTSPVCSIYETGKEMCDHKLNSIRNTIQQRFLVVWNKLKLTENEKQSCLLKFCWQHMSDTIYMANMNKALNLLEYAEKYIERREMLLHKLAKIEIEHLIQSKDYSLNDNHLELKCSDERYKVDKKFNKLEKLIESTAKQLEKKFNYTLTFNGQIYLKKMVHDRSDLIYLLREKYKSKPGHDSAI